MKYKVGDRVKIKSLDWYNENKDEYGHISCGYVPFISKMAIYCGKVLTICDIKEKFLYYHMKECEYAFTNEMIEGLVERNGKTYPYKIGDRVVLKGNNRCATITDLKYNSWGNLSYYVKIDNDKDISIDYPTELLLPYDNMIEEGLMEEETKPKFKVGDKITNGKVTLTILTLSSDRYVVEDTFGECGTLYFEFMDNWKLAEDETLIERVDDTGLPFNEWLSHKGAFHIPDGYELKDENGNVINATKIVLEKKKRYPTTIEECCEILGLEFTPVYTGVKRQINYKDGLLHNLKCLLIYRDAYWKLYGEEMGLGKPWEPSDSDYITGRYCIFVHRGNILCDTPAQDCILTFPTEEMRDAFKENFEELIEQCKELL